LNASEQPLAFFWCRRRNRLKLVGAQANIGIDTVGVDVKVQEGFRPEMKTRVVVPNVVQAFNAAKRGNEVVMADDRMVAPVAGVDRRAGQALRVLAGSWTPFHDR